MCIRLSYGALECLLLANMSENPAVEQILHTQVLKPDVGIN